jgi:hypothetical protein
MMSHEEWLSRILEVAWEVSSREFQEEAWLSGRPSPSSPTELYNQLFDDFTFDLFFETYSKDFSPDQTRAWMEFKQGLEKFAKKFPDFPNERVVIDDPDWQLVREAASRFITAFEHGEMR